MTARIVTRFGTPVASAALSGHAAATRLHLERPLNHARHGAEGQLWERIAAPGLPSWLWDGGRPVDDDDLWRKQRIEDDLAGDR